MNLFLFLFFILYKHHDVITSVKMYFTDESSIVVSNYFM